MYFKSAWEGNNSWHLYLIGFLLSMGGYLIGQIPLTLLLVYKVYSNTHLGPDDITAFQENMNFQKFGISTNVGFLLMIIIFVFAMLGLLLALKIHGKSLMSLITPNKKINYHKLLFGFGLWAIFMVVTEMISYYLHPEEYTFRFSLSSFLPLLLISVFLLPVQTSFEELFFRGYLMTGLGRATGSKYLTIIITSVLFALMHSMNPEVAKYGLGTMMFHYFSAGAFLAIITVMDDSLELALGVHAATNMLGATLVTYSGSVLQTDTLFLAQETRPWIMILYFYVAAITFYIICARKYNWAPIQKLAEPVLPPVPTQENIIT